MPHKKLSQIGWQGIFRIIEVISKFIESVATSAPHMNYPVTPASRGNDEVFYNHSFDVPESRKFLKQLDSGASKE